MPSWLIIIFVALLLVIAVVLVLLLLPDSEGAEGRDEEARYAELPAVQPSPTAALPPLTAAPPVSRPPAIVLRQPPAHEPKLLIRGRPATLRAEEFRPPPLADDGSKIRVSPVRVNLNVICRRTGRSMRVCSCERCERERAEFGL